MLTLNDGRNELWQWDTGRKLEVDAECSQVHFSNKVFGRSIDVDVVDGVAIIPDVLLQTDKDLTAWAFVGTPENGYTKISKVFKVNKRNKPADYVFTTPEQTSLEEIKEKIEYLESIQDPDAIKNAVEDYLEQNPVDAPVQSVNGKTGKVSLTALDVGAISQDDLQEATNEALAQAKASGEFNGKDGQDYVLTHDDKTEIAEMAADLVEVPEVSGGGYVVQDTAPEDTSVLWVDPTDNTEDEIPDSGGNVAYDEVQNLTDEQKAQARENIGAQPKGNYLTEHQSLEGYAKTTDIPTKPEDIGAQPAGNYLTEVPEGYAKTEDIPTDAEIIQLIKNNAPESSGGGIAVTGAKVGQTVKISAVDENGVPTAWESVDFPDFYTKPEIDAIMGSYVTDIDTLVGGDS